MDTQAQHVFDEAMKLPAQVREDLALHLMGSVELSAAEGAEVKQNWLEEVRRRAAASDRGETTGVPIEEAWPKITGKSWQPASSDDA
jgi:putative addiction module component (TIGR02574 family)